LTASYTWACNTAFGVDDLLLNDVPQDNNNLRDDHGPTPFDIRHTFAASYLYELPFQKLAGSNGRVGKLFLGGWQLSGVLTAVTGSPANITNSRSSYALSRPDYVAGVSPYLDNPTGTLKLLNPAAFVAVPLATASGASIRPGNLGHYAVRGLGSWTLDASL